MCKTSISSALEMEILQFEHRIDLKQTPNIKLDDNARVSYVIMRLFMFIRNAIVMVLWHRC